ncbi:MAG: SDR family oxidoreductase [Alphaproteobacteria bacterium]|nr:SDR family oxidoreductase [Alphaproteobacteria bacterium]
MFEGKVVLVSGAGSGLGRGIAALFARLGASLVICGRNEERLASAEQFLSSLGVKVHAKILSIREPDQVEALMDEVWERFGRLDVLVNNAGGQFPQEAIDFADKGWRAVVETNLNGTWFMMQRAARRWRDHNQQGNIVNIVAIFERGMPGIAHTGAARAAVTNLSKTMAVEWAPLGIRVNCVAPGTVATPGFRQYPPEGVESFQQCNVQRHPGDMHDVAQAVVYLAAESGKFITGDTIHVDAGQRLWGESWPAGKPDYFKVGV